MDSHRLSKISGSYTPFNEKEAVAPGWPFSLLFLYIYILLFFVIQGEPCADLSVRDPLMIGGGGGAECKGVVFQCVSVSLCFVCMIKLSLIHI